LVSLYISTFKKSGAKSTLSTLKKVEQKLQKKNTAKITAKNTAKIIIFLLHFFKSG
jgi:hypothetical protein